MTHSPLKSLGKDDLIDLFELHTNIATSLLKSSANKETFAQIIEKAMEMISADGATLYILKNGSALHFEVLKNKAFETGDQTFDPIPLSTKSIATDSLNKKETILIKQFLRKREIKKPKHQKKGRLKVKNQQQMHQK